ncbi:D-aminoacyl-tRNA deacylase [Chitiniphilus purpureus]|uniref:D-aminoacyl-tRNA deacylase n=1 Tax=Chitiniphilus purpureus TaxID=2981137 RepID=A0ABY6DLR1_9NEIS|nr:D-aminoacyl-tRNA deacylase [Chitiniphilus sp. CD1]UXY15286.1 D-aminoacyl-tRNA deacylase [Chitiniphilus sp. CD1]
MRILVQRVSQASVAVDGATVGTIGPGLLLLVGIEACDGETDIAWAIGKVTKLRIFPDEAGVMNRSALDAGAELLAISQFTLFASYRNGNRPSWQRAAPGPVAQPVFERLVAGLAAALGRPVPTGVFGADMQVALVNDGPVTLLLDSRDPQ